MNGNTDCQKNTAKVAALKDCLVYILQDAKEANLGWCALHLKIAISELNSIMDRGLQKAGGKANGSLNGQTGIGANPGDYGPASHT